MKICLFVTIFLLICRKLIFLIHKFKEVNAKDIMDLTQQKLSREEWESIETPISADEKHILKMIIEGYDDVNIRSNNHLSMISFVKIENTKEVEYFLYQKYFHPLIKDPLEKYGKALKITIETLEGSNLKRLKSADTIRLQHLENNIKSNQKFIFEYLLIELCGSLLLDLHNKKVSYAFYLYTLMQLKKSSIKNINTLVTNYVDKLIAVVSKYTNPSTIMTGAYDFIEKNPYLLKYEDRCLFKHQKELFAFCKSHKDSPKLVLYTAPTGTGKTLSPIGLSNESRIIFVCVARHIGLALAKSAISMEKKVAFAFGCETASDIRLHYYSAVNYIKNARSGAIAKVDNSEGSKVEIMICDVQSYLTAMHYMLAFNNKTNIITYWDEPTITMDYESHALHEIIHRNWSENKIPNVILSCATLPKEEDIISVINDYREKFDLAEVHTITSHDCRKSIPILNKDGYSVLPHILHSNYMDLMKCVRFCTENKTLLRYFDLREIIRFIEYVDGNEFIEDSYDVDSYFQTGIQDITMDSLKNYYLTILNQVKEEDWTTIYNHMKTTQEKRYTGHSIRKSTSVDSHVTSSSMDTDTSVFKRLNSTSTIQTSSSPNPSANGILITTADAYTLTDGPTIFLCEDVKKIGNFYIQQSNISSTVFQSILQKITKNNEIMARIKSIESIILEKQTKVFDDTAKNQKSGQLIQKSNSNKDTAVESKESEKMSEDTEKLMSEITNLRKEIRRVSLDPSYVPNTRPHQEKWAPNGNIVQTAFMPNIDEETAKIIMLLEIDNYLKVLLLLGIGMFLENANIHYMEIMKKLADTQKLFIIIASSDYIYGTNYQFCHGFIGKDLTNMTQQKTLQAMGRIGRNNIQQDYTVRFRDDDMIMNLFKTPDHNMEAINMCALFSSSE